jgi:hypothetical protein
VAAQVVEEVYGTVCVLNKPNQVRLLLWQWDFTVLMQVRDSCISTATADLIWLVENTGYRKTVTSHDFMLVSVRITNCRFVLGMEQGPVLVVWKSAVVAQWFFPICFA